ncbi:hypothetical protein ENBRE01_1982 [Enteropsectra breve]|nr:hypothetical protein ENBRE01_1982 [Enteropsectra breve]
MVWGGFNFCGKTKLHFFEEKINSDSYVKALKQNLILFIREQRRRECIFQQDNARLHNADATID